MKKNKLAIGSVIVIVLVLAGAAYFVFGRREASDYSFLTVAKANIVEEVKTSGKVKAAEEVGLAFERGGRVATVRVSTGETVKRGALLVSLDGTDAAATKEQAEAALTAAKIALEKMQRPPEALDLLQAENAVAEAADKKAKAENDLAKAYDAANSFASDAFVDLRTSVSGLKDILHNSDFNPNQDNIDFYADSALAYDSTAGLYRLQAENSYQNAETVFNNASVAVRTAGVASNDEEIAKITDTAYDAAKAVSSAVKDASALVSLYIGKLNEKAVPVPTTATAHSTALSALTAKMNADFSALGGAIRAIDAGKDSVSSSGRSYSERVEALAKLKAGAEDIDIRAQQTRVASAEAAVTAARSQFAKTVLVAPFDGVVSSVDVSVGEMASTVAPAVSLVSNAKFEIEVLVSEADIAKVVVGTKAVVTLDTFPDQKFSALVVSVNPAQTITNGVGAYGIKLQFEKDDDRIKSGMTANIALETQSLANVLAVPGSAIISRGSEKLVLKDNGAGVPVQLKVVVGATDANGLVQIVSGLNAGDKVAVFGTK